MPVRALLLLAALASSGQIPSDGELPERQRLENEVVRLQRALPPELLEKPPKLDDERNAFRLWKEAFERFRPLESGELEDLAFRIAYDAEPLPDDEAARELERWIEANEDVVELIEEGSRRGALQSLEPSRLGDVAELNANPPLGVKARYAIAQLMALRAAKARLRGELDGALRETEGLLAYAGLSIRDSTGDLVGLLVSVGQYHMALQTMEPLTSSPGISPEALRSLIEQVAALPDPRRTCVPVFRRTAIRPAAILPVLAALPERGKPGEIADSLAEVLFALPEGRGAEAARIFRRGVAATLEGHPDPLDREASARLLGELILRASVRATRPWNEQELSLLEDVERELEAWPEILRPLGAAGIWLAAMFADERREPGEKELEETRKALAEVRNPVGKLLVLELGGTVVFQTTLEKAFEVETHRRLLLLLIALRIHELEEGELPESLDALGKKGILDRLPPDPYSGDPFGYSAERRLIWSAGPWGKTAGTSHLRDADGSLYEWVMELPSS